MERLNGKYAKLFEGDAEEDGVDKRGVSFEEFWGWIAVVDMICDGRREQWDYVFDMNVVEFLNTVSYVMDKRKNGLK